MPNEQFLHSELTKKIIGVFYEVYNELGSGFLESVYENSLVIALRQSGLLVHQQIAVPVWYRQNKVGDFTADLLVDKLVLLELKVAKCLEDIHVAQLINYLKATPIEVGLVLNFGPRPDVKRVAFSNQRKNLESAKIDSDPRLSALSASSALNLA